MGAGDAGIGAIGVGAGAGAVGATGWAGGGACGFNEAQDATLIVSNETSINLGHAPICPDFLASCFTASSVFRISMRAMDMQIR
jgi:hypothetical protein